MLRRFRLTCVVALALVGGTLTAISSSAAATTASSSAPQSQPDPAATSMAADQHISLAEAEKRLGWQQHADDLKTRVRAALGTRKFGGLWIDPDDGDRLKVGVVGPANTDRTTMANAAAAEGVAGAVDVVAVRHSEAQLLAAMDQISERLVSVNKQAPWPIQLKHWVRGNRLELALPRTGTLTMAQRALVDEVRSRYGDLLQTVRYARRGVGGACSFPYCDPPLRAGIQTNGPVGGFCTGGFLARSRSDNKLYIFTAGHCPWAGGTSTWWTRFTNGDAHNLGPAWNGLWDSRGDMGIIQITNEAGWNPRAWVVVYASPDSDVAGTVYDPDYSITKDSGSTEGQRVCKTGVGSSTYDTSCGKVTRLGVTYTYSVKSVTGFVRTETVKYLGEATYCTVGGDSGGPIYANHTAYGINVASAYTCGQAYYQGIHAAEDAMNVDVAHDAG